MTILLLLILCLIAWQLHRLVAKASAILCLLGLLLEAVEDEDEQERVGAVEVPDRMGSGR